MAASTVATAATVIAAVAAVAGATVAGVSAEQQAQAQSDAIKSEAKLRNAQSRQTARQLRKANAKRIAAMENQVLRGGGTGLLVTSDLDLIEQNASELELQAFNVETLGVNTLALGKAASDSFKEGGRSAAAGEGLAGVGRASSAIGSGFAVRARASSPRTSETRSAGAGGG